MAKFDEFKQTTADTAEMIAGKSIQFAKVAAEKTKQFAKITKLKAEILAEKDSLRKSYNKLGKLYYELYGKEAEEPMKETVGMIDESYKRIAEMKDRINEIKAETASNCEDIEIEIEVISNDREEAETTAKDDEELPE